MDEETIGKAILDAAFRVHTELGPGLLESVYEAALAFELTQSGFTVERQKSVAARYRGVELDVGFRADLIVDRLVLIELKSVESLQPVFKKVTLTYLRLSGLRLGYLINFNEPHLKSGIIRIVNNLPDHFPKTS